jgi:hypothetical protein
MLQAESASATSGAPFTYALDDAGDAAMSPQDDNDEDNDEDEDDETDPNPLLLSQLIPDASDTPDNAFTRAARQLKHDPDLYPRELQGDWKARSRTRTTSSGDTPEWIEAVGRVIAFLIENLLWLLFGLALLLIVLNYRRWLPWLRPEPTSRVTRAAVAIETRDLPDVFPDDPRAAVRELWRDGQRRAALSLLYRAALADLVARVGRPLPTGATEAEGLRLSRKLGPHPFAAVFSRVVRCWQAAAYADRWPAESELLQLLDAWQAAEAKA